MTQKREQRIKSLFEQAADMSRNERIEYLNRACDDNEMVEEVLALCEGEEESEAHDFWEKGAWVIKSSINRKKIMIGENIHGYKIIKDLGGGGMGEVYLAERTDGLLDRKAVIKFVRAHLLKDEQARFKGEMKAQESLNHPNIARIFDAGLLEDGSPFMILEFVEGQGLRELLTPPQNDPRQPRKQIALPLKDVVEITEEICSGLAEAHRKKIVHRDIKPENIIVRKDGDKYKIKIIDFGLALPQESGMLPTRKPTSGIAGTPEYMAPEQVMPEKFYLNKPDEKPGTHADIYSLGVVIYEMLTGSRPFSGSGYQVARKHIEEEVVAPSKVRSDLKIPKPVDQVVLKALSKMPGDRQKTIERLSQELKAAYNDGNNVIRELDGSVPVTMRSASQPDRRKFLWALPVALIALLFFKSLELKPGSNEEIRPTPTVSASPSVSLTPTPSPAPTSAAPSLTMAVSVVRQDKRRKEGTVPLDTIFHDGERVRVSIRAAQKGYLYILQQGSSGRVSVLYPHQRIGGGRNEIAMGQEVIIPSGNGWFRFDKNPGTETVYFLYAENRTEGVMNGIAEATASNGSAFAVQLAKQAVDLSKTGGSFSGQGVLVGVLKLRHQP
jgi:serine/threonine protein kinase